MKRRKARSGGLVWLLVAAMCAMCGALVAAPAAWATPTLVGTFTGSDTPDGSLSISTSTHVAADESTGDVYVTDAAHDAVDRFDSNGAYNGLQIQGSSTTATTFGFGNAFDDIAVDNSGTSTQGDIYVLSRGSNTLFAFAPDGSERWEVLSPDGSWCGVGLDPTGHPWIGDTAVAQLTQLDPSDGSATGTTIPTSGTYCHLGFDSQGAAYAASHSGTTLDKYDGGGGTQTIDPLIIANSVATSFNQNTFFAVGLGVSGPTVRQWDTSGAQIFRMDGPTGSDNYTGVAFNGRLSLLYVVDANSGGGSIQIYSVPPLPPIVTQEAPSDIAPTSATLNARVNPNGSDVTDCHGEYETDAQFTADGGSFASPSSAPCSGPTLTGTSDLDVTVSLTGLTPGTTYHTRIVATNGGGTTPNDTTTGDVLLTTTIPSPPIVVTGAASGITETGATLAGTVNPNGGDVTDCHIDYGTSTSYGSSVPCSPSPGSGSSAVAVSGAVTGLSAGTTYHFRVVATNAGGTTNGDDATFTTTSRPTPTCQTDPSLPGCQNCQNTPSLCPRPVCPGDLSLCHPHLHLNGGWSWVGSNGFLRVKCSDDLGGTCAGKLTLKATVKVKVKRGHRTVVKKKTITVGTASYSLAVGGTARLKVKLTSAGKRALKKGGLTAKVTSDKDGKLGSVRIPKMKVRRAKHKRK